MVSLVRCDSKDAFKTNFAPVLRELWRFRIHSAFTQYWANRQNERALTTNRRLLSFQIHQRIEGYCSIERATALLSVRSFREYQVHFSSTLIKYTFHVYLGGIDMWCVSMGSPLPMNFFWRKISFLGPLRPRPASQPASQADCHTAGPPGRWLVEHSPPPKHGFCAPTRAPRFCVPQRISVRARAGNPDFFSPRPRRECNAKASGSR